MSELGDARKAPVGNRPLIPVEYADAKLTIVSPEGEVKGKDVNAGLRGGTRDGQKEEWTNSHIKPGTYVRVDSVTKGEAEPGAPDLKTRTPLKPGGIYKLTKDGVLEEVKREDVPESVRAAFDSVPPPQKAPSVDREAPANARAAAPATADKPKPPQKKEAARFMGIIQYEDGSSETVEQKALREKQEKEQGNKQKGSTPPAQLNSQPLQQAIPKQNDARSSVEDNPESKAGHHVVGKRDGIVSAQVPPEKGRLASLPPPDRNPSVSGPVATGAAIPGQRSIA